MAFGPEHLLLRVCGKIFACMPLEHPDGLTLKCAPDYALELRERYPDIEPAWHWNKKYWNQLRLNGHLADNFILSLIRHSYSEVVRKLPKSVRESHPEIMGIKEG